MYFSDRIRCFDRTRYLPCPKPGHGAAEGDCRKGSRGRRAELRLHAAPARVVRVRRLRGPAGGDPLGPQLELPA